MKNLRKIFAFGWFLSILTLSNCANQNLQEGIAYFKIQNYREAFVRLKPEAHKGQIDAQYAIGYMYYYGQGVIENRKKACFWINKAAISGQKEALKAVSILKTSRLE